MIPVEAHGERAITSFDAFPARVCQELEICTIAATALEREDVRILGWRVAALELVHDCAARNE
jgi:hypothetical protein